MVIEQDNDVQVYKISSLDELEKIRIELVA